MTQGSETPIGADEVVARFVLRKEHVRPGGSIKADPFVPYSHVELSVTRHVGLSEKLIWIDGDKVAENRGPLVGRVDVQVARFEQVKLKVFPDPLEGRPNHANVKGWPVAKEEQKLLALELVRGLTLTPVPIKPF